MRQMSMNPNAAENITINARYDWASHGWSVSIASRQNGQEWPQKATSTYGPLTSDELLDVVTACLGNILEA